MPYQEQQSRATFIRKLSFYLFGIALGFAMLGLFQQSRKAHLQKLHEQQRAADEAAKNAPSPFPPLPPPPTASPEASPAPPAN